MTLAHHWAGGRASAFRAAVRRPVVESLRELSASRRAIISVFVMTATIMQVLDTTVANVSLPYMQGTLSTTQDQINWVLTSYIIASAIMTSPVGWMSARFGRKRLYIVCTAGFTVASMLCGVSQNIEQMVLFRLTQGAFGAALVPLAQAVMLDAYPTAQRAAAMAIWGMGIMLGPIMGPVLGGYLTENYSWRWVFYVNVPFGLLTALGLSVFMPESRIRRDLPFAWFGFLSLSLGVGALQMMLDRGQDIGWFDSSEIWAEAILSVAGFYFFVADSFTAERPFIEMRLFRDRNFSLALVLMFLNGLVLMSTMALLTPMLQNLLGYPVLASGYLLGARGIGTFVAMSIVGRLLGTRDARPFMLFGLALATLAQWVMVGLERRRLRQRDRVQRHDAGLRPRLRLHAAQHHRVLDPAQGAAHRSDRTVDAGAQHRRLDRHLDSHRQTGQPHRLFPQPDRRARHAVQRRDAPAQRRGARRPQPAQPRHARRDRDAAGGGDVLFQRLPA